MGGPTEVICRLRWGTKFVLVGVSREILFRSPKAQEREREAGGRTGSGSACSAGWANEEAN